MEIWKETAQQEIQDAISSTEATIQGEYIAIDKLLLEKAILEKQLVCKHEHMKQGCDGGWCGGVDVCICEDCGYEYYY